MSYAVGDEVVVTQKGRWEDEPGMILAFAGSNEKLLAVVACAGWQPLIPVDMLESEGDRI